VNFQPAGVLLIAFETILVIQPSSRSQKRSLSASLCSSNRFRDNSCLLAFFSFAKTFTINQLVFLQSLLRQFLSSSFLFSSFSNFLQISKSLLFQSLLDMRIILPQSTSSTISEYSLLFVEFFSSFSFHSILMVLRSF